MSKKIILQMILVMLMISILGRAPSIRPVKGWIGTVYIKADGSIDPPGAPITTLDNVTYTFTDDITSVGDGIIVQRDNITIDGDGYRLQGSEENCGISVGSNVTIKNTEIRAFDIGVSVEGHDNNITGNNITGSYWIGIDLLGDNNSIVKNVFVDCGLYWELCKGSVVRDNVVNGKPLAYLENAENLKVENAGQVILIRSNNITVNNLNLSCTTLGVQLYRSSNSTIINNNIANNTIAGIWLYSGSNNNISSNNITANYRGNAVGILADDDYGIAIARNNITGNVWGLQLYWMSGNLSQNNIANNRYGIFTGDVSGCNVIGNNIAANDNYGVYLYKSADNSFKGNNITSNDYGIELDDSSGNKFYHNNFINNLHQVFPLSSGLVNVWNGSYPSGGNYWSDYSDVDLYRGPGQNEPGNDSIWDHPYVIDANNQDHYAFVNLCNIYALTITATSGGTTNPQPGIHWYDKVKIVPVIAVPDLHSDLDHWELDGSNVGAASPISITTDTDHALRAVFAVQHTITITTTSGGTTSPAPGTYYCRNGSVVSVWAIPTPDYFYHLDHWELDGINRGAANPILVTMNVNHTLWVFFTYSPHADIGGGGGRMPYIN
jgi:parallel beta-helix repeat protein